MAEIKVPPKRSFINTPVGVAKTDAGEARAAQQIANASRTLSNATFNTASQIMQAGQELQQSFEERKFSDWAQQIPIRQEDGEYSKYEMPSYISGRTRNQIDRILQSRYKVDSEVRLREYMVQSRTKHKNNEEAFSSDVSNFVQQTKAKISASGGAAYAQDFSDMAVQLQSQHINDIRKNLSTIADTNALVRVQRDIQEQRSLIETKILNNDPTAQEDIESLQVLISELPQNYQIQAEGVVNLKKQVEVTIGKATIIAAGFPGLTPVQRQIAIAELQTGKLDKTLAFMPELQALVSFDGVLNSTQKREEVARALSNTDGKLRNADNFAQQQESLRNTEPFGFGVKHQKAAELSLKEKFGIETGNPMALVSAAQSNPDVADELEGSHVLPFSLINTLKARQSDPGNINDLDSLFKLVDVTKNAVFDLTGDKVTSTDKGLDPETMAFVLAVDGIKSSYDNPESQLEAINRLSGNIQERDVLGRKFAEAGYFTERQDYTGTTSINLARDALIRQDKYNPEFVERFAGVYARLAGAVPIATADSALNKIYNTYYKQYEHAYVPSGGYKEQAYMPNSYYDGIPLQKFKGASVNIMNKLSKETNNAVRYEMGTTAFLRPDPMNTREYGRWVFVNEQGQPLRNITGGFITVDTTAIEAETVLQKRMRMNEEEMEKALRVQEARIERSTLITPAIALKR